MGSGHEMVQKRYIRHEGSKEQYITGLEKLKEDIDKFTDIS